MISSSSNAWERTQIFSRNENVVQLPAITNDGWDAGQSEVSEW